jgi:hypothetical protein
LRVTTDARCPEGASGAEVTLASLGIAASEQLSRDTETVFSATRDRCDAPGEVGSLVLVPAEGRDGSRVDILVIAAMIRDGLGQTLEQCEAAMRAGSLEGTTCVVARRRLGFIDNLPLDLPLEIETRCIGVTCDEDSTCFGGECVSATLECDARGDCGPPGEAGSGGAGAGPVAGGGPQGGAPSVGGSGAGPVAGGGPQGGAPGVGGFGAGPVAGGSGAGAGPGSGGFGAGSGMGGFGSGAGPGSGGFGAGSGLAGGPTMLCASFLVDCALGDCNVTCEESGCGTGTCVNDVCTCSNMSMQ